MSTSYTKILSQIQESYKSSDKKLISDAFDFAQKAHGDQKRVSGEKYIVHPLNTALTLAEMNLDAKTVAAGLLHDVIDDTSATREQIEKKFGSEVAFLVEGVSKLGKIKYRGVERHSENLRKMLIAIAQDFRVVLIKLADRYHNLRTLEVLPAATQKRIALESLEIYAPLAFRFGVSELSKKIEDISFKYCYPQEYNMILAGVQKRYPQREKYLAQVVPHIQAGLVKENIRPIKIQTRAKHYWSLYKKLKKSEMNWDKVHDLVAMRIIVKNIEDCYAALGVIHNLWRPLPGRIKDYIALPKPNGYRSLHTTVFCKGGNITEFQIRTGQMHETAENGIAAHWLYSETDKTKRGGPSSPRQFAWIKQIREWQKEMRESTDFIENLKIDIFSDRIFVFTPEGDVIDLPEGATPVDFAYAIHSTVGNTCSQAKVNGEIYALNQELKNGDMIEIIKSSRKHPSRDWLMFVKTNAAKARIRNYLKKTRSEEKIQQGKNLLDKELEKLNQDSWANIPQKKRDMAFQNLPYKNEALLFAAVGEGDISAYRIIKYVVDAKTILAQRAVPTIKPIYAKDKKHSGVKLQNVSNITTRIALCCSPIPGEKISGYITRSAYAAIHKDRCANIKRLTGKNPDRAIQASWQSKKGAHFVKIKIAAFDRVGLLQEVSSTISNMGVNIISMSAEGENTPTLPVTETHTQDQPDARLHVVAEIFDVDQLRVLMRSIERIKSVREVKRI